MEINTFCPECGNGLFLDSLPDPGWIPCPRCGKGREAEGKAELDGRGAVLKCGLCGCTEFYRQKDFNTKLGLWLVALMAGLALVFHRWMIPILAGFTALDLALYFGLPDVVLCYSCRALYRGMPPPPGAGGFDLKVHDKYAFKGRK